MSAGISANPHIGQFFRVMRIPAKNGIYAVLCEYPPASLDVELIKGVHEEDVRRATHVHEDLLHLVISDYGRDDQYVGVQELDAHCIIWCKGYQYLGPRRGGPPFGG